MNKLTRATVALTSALMLAGGAVGTASAADARRAPSTHTASYGLDACSKTLQTGEPGWWNYAIRCQQGR